MGVNPGSYEDATYHCRPEARPRPPRDGESGAVACRRYSDLINDDDKLLENSFVVPDAALADVPASLRGPAEPTPGAAGSAGNGGVPRVPFVTA